MKKYIINKVKTFDGVRYAIQTSFTHYPIQYDAKGNMLTEKRNVKSRKKDGPSVIAIDVPKVKETETLHTVEYRKEYVNSLNGKKYYRTEPALFENNSAGLAEAKRIRDLLVERDKRNAEREEQKAE